MNIFVTHFNHRYLSRGLALIQSLGSKTNILVFCHDNKTYEVIQGLGLENLTAIELEILENAYPELDSAKSSRAILEYYFLLSPYVVHYALTFLNASLAVYIDADTFFFQDPNLALAELDPYCDVAIIPHRFDTKNSYMNKYGIYNVGWVSFRNTTGGMQILEFWRESCLNSTSTVPTEKIFGDQKYLDFFAKVGPGVQVISHPGMNAAPWNCRDVKLQNQVLFHEELPLIFFHFSGLKNFAFFSAIGFAGYSKRPKQIVKRQIYKKYISTLARLEKSHDCNNRQIIGDLNFKGWAREFYYFDLLVNFNLLKGKKNF
jgi:hypothetical protein